MCGIAGLWSIEGKELPIGLFALFLDSLSHRGPDGRGLFKDPDEALYLGHRRLAILDLSERGIQPMGYGTKRYWITFNGEIYNFLEIRKELESLGHVFFSDTDTEVILASYVEWGAACQLKFNGMWAFAIWDGQEKSLFLSRDRFGVKPLYYMYDGKRLAFASELKAFAHLPEFEINFDEQILSNTLYDVNSIESSEHSWIKSVKRLQAGYSALLTKGGHFSIRRWWDTLDHLVSIPTSWEEQVAQFRNIFLDACRLRLRSDVPTATALSGGLDSSSVLAAISHIRHENAQFERMPNEWRQVFSAKFPKTSQDESIFAQQMIDHTKTIPLFCEINSNCLTQHLDHVLYDLENIFDLPIGPWMLYRHVRQNGTVISIDGHGPDELLGGYHHHVETALANSLFPMPTPWRTRELNNVLQGMFPEGSPFQRASYPALVKKAAMEHLHQTPKIYQWLRACFRKLGLAKGLQKSWLQIPPESRYYTTDHPHFQKWGLFDQSLYLDFHQKTLPTILRNFDRCSMAHGVEIRAPFLDWRLVCYTFSLKNQAKIGQGFTKRILREAMKGLLPESIRTRTTKIGFASPMHEWLKADLKPFMLDSLHSSSFQTSPIWNGPQILRFVENGYKNGNINDVRTAWEFVQADRLMALFKRQIAQRSF